MSASRLRDAAAHAYGTAREAPPEFWLGVTREAYGSGGLRGAARVARALKHELGGAGLPSREDVPPVLRAIDATPKAHEYRAWADTLRTGPAPLAPCPVGRSRASGLHIAFIIPPFGYGSGGHEVVFRLVAGLERAGNACSVWVDDPFGAGPSSVPVIRRRIEQCFGVAFGAPIHTSLDAWSGSDVVVATGWQTVWPVLRLPGCRARAYLVNDYEPAFYPASIESELARATYDEDLYCITGTTWLLDRLQVEHGASGRAFDYPVAPSYRPRPTERRDDSVVVYARMVTPRRAVPLAILALDEIINRRGREMRVVMFGNSYAPPAPFSYDFVSHASPEQLAWLYSEAAVGMAFSLTNASLVPQDMAACGLPCVEIDRGAAHSTYARGGPIRTAAFDVQSVADEVEAMLDDRAARRRAEARALEFGATRTWARATDQVGSALREALRLREA